MMNRYGEKHLTISNVPEAKMHGSDILDVALQGGSPWFGHVYINDVCYTITLNGGKEAARINKTR